jgi:predicted nucleic acid-binding protein
VSAGVVLDAGGLIALDRNLRSVVVLLARVLETGATVTVPAPALAQAIRAPQRQVHLARLIRQPNTHVLPLNRADAVRIGGLLAKAGTRDVVDAHVVLCAQQTGQAVLTSDPDDLRKLDDAVRLIAV